MAVGSGLIRVGAWGVDSWVSGLGPIRFQRTGFLGGFWSWKLGNVAKPKPFHTSSATWPLKGIPTPRSKHSLHQKNEFHASPASNLLHPILNIENTRPLDLSKYIAEGQQQAHLAYLHIYSEAT